jgi:hypothetical protein
VTRFLPPAKGVPGFDTLRLGKKKEGKNSIEFITIVWVFFLENLTPLFGCHLALVTVSQRISFLFVILRILNYGRIGGEDDRAS